MFGLLRPANAAARAGMWECKSYVCISCQTYTLPFLHHQTGRQLIGKPLFAVALNPTLLADYRLLRSGKGCSDLKACPGLVLVQKGSETVRNLTGG